MGFVSKTRKLSVGLLVPLALLAAPTPSMAGFGIADFTVSARNASGAFDERAATHPFDLGIHLTMNADQSGQPEGTLREVRTDLPPGLIGNPLAIPRCPLAEFQKQPPQCGAATQIGRFRGLVTDLGLVGAPLYNLQPLPGTVATFGLSLNGETHLQLLNFGGKGASSAVSLRMVLPSSPAILDVEEDIWGVPADPAHDPERVCLGSGEKTVEGCSSEAEERPLLTLPASCAEPLRTTLTAISAGEIPLTSVATAVSRDAAGNPRALGGCEAVPFDPLLTVLAGASAASPTSLAIGLTMPGDEGSELANASLASMRLDFPAGLNLNPAAGSWLSPASWLGSVKLWTPLIDHPLVGSVRLAASTESRSSLPLDIELAIEDEATGTSMTIPGVIEADPQTGRLTASIDDLPQLPIESLELEFAAGPRALLASPPECGTYGTQATLRPSTAPFAPSLPLLVPMAITGGPGGEPCPLPEAERNAAPSLRAGTLSPAAATVSPLVIQLSRQDTDQRFGSFDLTLPPGLVANLGSVPLGSQVGSVRVRAGVGPDPLVLQGTAYLEGPYRGAPYSLALVVPAQVGPFDLGAITERVALSVDQTTAQITARADPLPQIIAGVPLQLRELRIDLDRPGFIRNPTSCGPAAIAGTATSALGKTASLFDRFAVANCRGLGFKPKAALRFSGSLRRNGHPAVRVVLSGGSDEASIASAVFSLPRTELLDLRHLRGLCAQGTAPPRCPDGSRLGRLRLSSPLFDQPAEGSVYLVAPSRRLPELVAEVRSGDLRFVLHGRTVIRKGRFGISFPAIPDIPLSRAVLSLDGGRSGLFVNSRSPCGGVGEAEALLSAHSGKKRELRLRPQVSGRCRSA